jgi:hypothetical protein
MHLLGYDLHYGEGSSLTVTLVCQATDSVLHDYTAFVHLMSAGGELISQHDSAPPLSTSLWVPGLRVIATHTLAFPEVPTSNPYQLRVGLYRWPSIERLPIISAGCLDVTDKALLAAQITPSTEVAPDGTGCPDLPRIVISMEQNRDLPQ